MRYDRDTVKEWAGDSQWRACRADFARFRMRGFTGWGSEGFWALVIYRLQRALAASRYKLLSAPAWIVLAIARKLFTVITHIDIHPDAQIGPGLLINHGGPIRIHGATRIGADCAIHHGCTIGAGPQPGGAIIGDHVHLGCTSSIIGKVHVGDGAVVAANSLLLADVPAGFTAIGVPARNVPFQMRHLGASIEAATPNGQAA
jgi:serine O-acetyltransferase